MTAFLPIVTVSKEGGYYSAIRDQDAPIRIYPDRWIEDEFWQNCFGVKKVKVRRERLSRSEFNRVRREAKQNAKEGRV